MSGFMDTVLFFVIFNIVGSSDALVELPQVAENDILNTETIIRATTNKLFTSIKLKGVKKNPKLKQYALIHNYFVSLTLKDYKNLKEIAGLTRTDKKTIDNSSINFIDLLNEILNEDSLDFETKSNISLYHAFEDEILKYIDEYSHNLAYLKQTYGDNSPRVDINKGIINILESERFLNKTALTEQENSLPSDYDNLLDDNEFWAPDKSFRRIYQGQRSKIKYFPFMASVQLFNKFQCGGSIIKDDLVITAASCLQLAWNNRLFRENPSFLSVRIGSNYYNGGGENIPVLEVFFYPTYNPQKLRNNIAIMRLTRKIKFRLKRKSRVKKIDFDRRDTPLPMTVHGVTIVGWGAKSQRSIVGSPWDNKLSFAVLDVYILQDCQDIYSKDYVTDMNFCAGFLSKGGGACSRDVGGPGIVSGVLTGIVSFGSPICGTPDAPTVFTKVGYYADWIEGIMEKESPFIKKGSTLLTTLNTIYSPIDHYKTTRVPITPRITVPYPPVPVLETSTNPEDKIFKQFLKTMFDSKEIDEYLDFADDDKDVADNNAAIIGIRQEQLSQSGPYVQERDPNIVTPIVLEDTPDTTEPFLFSTPGTVADESFKAIEYATKVDDIQIFNPNNDVEDEAIVSSQENIELNNQIDSEDDVESRKELQNNIMKLIDNVNLKEKIAEAAKKDSTILDKDQDLDNTILTLLYMSDSENEGQKNGVRLVSGDNQIHGENEGTYVENEEERMSEDAGAKEDLEEDTDNMYDHQELRLDDETVEETQEKPDNEISNEKESLKKDSKAKGGNFDDVFSKKVLFDILSEVIDYQNKNKTVNTT